MIGRSAPQTAAAPAPEPGRVPFAPRQAPALAGRPRRLRLLPLTIFAASLLLTVKLGALFTPGGPVREAVTIAPTSAQQAPAAATQPNASQPAKPTSLTPPAPGAAPAAAPGAPAAAAPAKPAASGNAPAPAGAAPGTPAASPPAAASAKAREPAIDPVNMSQSEIDILQALAERRRQLDEREHNVDQREALLKAAEQRISEKVNELKTIQAKLETLVKKQESDREEQLKRLVKVYESMKPKDAARIFEQLDDGVLIDVAERMKAVKLAPVLASMDPKKATAVTTELAKRRESKSASGALPGG